MFAAWIVLIYLLTRVFPEVYKFEQVKFSLGQILASFGLLTLTVILVFFELELLNDILSREFSDTFLSIFIFLGFVFGYELSNLVFKFFQFQSSIKYFFSSLFAILSLILATFLIIFA